MAKLHIHEPLTGKLQVWPVDIPNPNIAIIHCPDYNICHMMFVSRIEGETVEQWFEAIQVTAWRYLMSRLN